MAKKPKPTSKERRRRKQLDEARRLCVVDNHHILFDRCLWDGNCHGELRRDLDLIVAMDRGIHDELHRKVPPIPPLGNNLTMCVIKYYHQLQSSAKRDVVSREGNSVVGIALLKLALDQVVKRSRVTPLEVQQIALMQDNLNAQIEYILRSNELICRRQSHAQEATPLTCPVGQIINANSAHGFGRSVEDDLDEILGAKAFT